jgi:hypothetical protein
MPGQFQRMRAPNTAACAGDDGNATFEQTGQGIS